jgi:hypothetical protein
MHVSVDSHERRSRNRALVLLGLVVLLAVVAIASSGHVPMGTSNTRRPSHELADTLLSLLVVFVLVGGVGIFYVYYLQRTNSHEERRAGRAKRSRRALAAFITFMALLIALAVRAAVHYRHHHLRSDLGSGTLPAGVKGGKDSGYTPRFAPIPVAVVLGAAAIAGLAAYLSHRARRGALRPLALEPSLALTLADVLGETLDDLRAEPDPRIAVIAAYARLERTLASFGVPRRDSDAPLEYLRRILVDLEAGSGHASRLTQLFEHAKFSTHEVGPEMKEEAIALLESIRADLQAADAARAAALPTAQTAEQPA